MKQKPLIIRGFGIYCSKTSSYNPKIIEVLSKYKNNQKYESLGNFKLSLSVGTQILTTEEVIFNDIEKIKFVIKESYGGKKTHINKIYLYEYLPSSEFNMSYQDIDININDENETNKNNSKTSNAMNIRDLNINDLTNITNITNTNIKKEKVISNNLPTKTTDILITESDLTDKPKKKKKKYYWLEGTQDKFKIKTNNKNNNLSKISKNINLNENNQKSEQNNNINNEEEKQNISCISDNKEIIEQNISIQTKKKDLYNNSNIIFTTTDVKNNTLDNNNINTISNISNNKNNNYDEKVIFFKNKIDEYDLKISSIENDINNLKEVINEILNNLNLLINQNKKNFHKVKDENEYNYIFSECKKYIDHKMFSTLETLNTYNKNYYNNTQSYNYNNSNNINKKLTTQNINNSSEVFYNNPSKEKDILYTNGNINVKTSNNLRNNISLSKIFKIKNKRPKLTQQLSNNYSHKNIFHRTNIEKSFDDINNRNDKLNNKSCIKKEKYKKIKKEEEKEIEKILNNKLKKKLSNFNEEIENKIYKSLVKPTLRKLEKNLQNNFESIKEKLRSHSVNYSQTNIKNVKTTRAVRFSHFHKYFNDKNNLDSNKRKNLFNISNNLNYNNNLNSNNNNYEIENNYNFDNNDIETEKIKKNIVEKQKQLNDLLFELNNKQNESLNYYISFRKNNKNIDIKQNYYNEEFDINNNIQK